jgi:hypothetical protein
MERDFVVALLNAKREARILVGPYVRLGNALIFGTTFNEVERMSGERPNGKSIMDCIDYIVEEWNPTAVSVKVVG